MKVRELGEFGLIEMLARIVDPSGVGRTSSPDLIIGIGDDTAAWQSGDTIQLGTTDMLVQNVHFTLDTITWHDLGWKSLAVNISDIAAMGGTPTYAMISLGLPPDTEVESVAELYQGMAQIAHRFNMAIVGGNLTEAPLLIISPSLIGRAAKDKIMTRSGARPGDQIAVTGYLGTAAAGLVMLNENLKFDPKISSVLREAHLRPNPRVTEGQILTKGGVRAAIDISDGLIADLGHICEASKVKARVHLPDIPIHPAVKAAFGEKALNLALAGGEDYELVFTASPAIIQNVVTQHAVPPQFTIIGQIEDGEPGKVILLDANGKEIEFKKGGWEHFDK
jgi:thiamine-monophosphate kinase